MKLQEIYPRISMKIQPEDLKDLEQPLKISAVSIKGTEKRKTVWLEFNDTALQHKCSKEDVFLMAETFGTNETDDFIDKEINLVESEGKIVVETTKKKNKK